MPKKTLITRLKEQIRDIIITDVSGKGVPAALFMMVSRILLANRILLGGTPEDILADVNNQLCEKKMENMFG